MRAGSRAAAAVLAVAASMLCPLLTWAEVGVHLQTNDDSDLKVPYIISGITDSPDPFGSAWGQLTGSSSRIVLNSEGYLNGDGPPSMVLNPFSDLVIVAWARSSASGFDVVVSHLSEDTWSAPQVLADHLDDALDPKLFVDPSDGTVHLVYWIAEESPRVMHRQAPPDLSSWTAPVQVSDVGEPACRPDGAIHGGELRVVYEAHNVGLGEPPLEIVMATRNGSTFTTETVEISYFPEKNWPEIHSAAGRLWIDWVDSEDQVGWIRLNPQGQWDPVEHEPYANSEELLYRIRGTIRLDVIGGE
jgi:hypothetical protein